MSLLQNKFLGVQRMADYAVQQPTFVSEDKPDRNYSGASAFLAAHAFLVWGDASNAKLIANLMDESYQQKYPSLCAAGSVLEAMPWPIWLPWLPPKSRVKRQKKPG